MLGLTQQTEFEVWSMNRTCWVTHRCDEILNIAPYPVILLRKRGVARCKRFEELVFAVREAKFDADEEGLILSACCDTIAK